MLEKRYVADKAINNNVNKRVLDKSPALDYYKRWDGIMKSWSGILTIIWPILNRHIQG